MTVPPEIESQIKVLIFHERWPVGTVARMLHVHRDVVERVCNADQRRRPKPRAAKARQIDPYILFIQQQLQLYPDLVSTRLYDMIQERGYEGSARRVRAVVAELRPRRLRVPALHVEVLAGEQSQIDWAHLGKHLVDGATRDVWLFVQVLSWSRALYAEVVLDLTCAGLLRSLVRAAQWFQGTTRHWLFDNAKSVVLDRGAHGVRFHPDLLELASSLHVQLQVCTPRRANEKGRVERAIRYLRERHFSGRTFVSRTQANADLLRFLSSTSLERPHMEDKTKTVGDMLGIERGRLVPLPTIMPSTAIPRVTKTNAYGFVIFETNEYAAPGTMQSEQVEIWADDDTIRLARDGKSIAEYRRSYGRNGRFGADALDRVDTALRGDRPGRSGRRRLIATSPLMVSLLEAWLDEGRNVGSQVARALKILDLHGAGAFCAAVDQLARSQSTDLAALERLCDQQRRASGAAPPSTLRFGAHVQDRDVEMPGLEDYDE